MSDDSLCPRTFCLWKPGVPLEGVRCDFYWTGDVPCTGRYLCFRCGHEATPRAEVACAAAQLAGRNGDPSL